MTEESSSPRFPSWLTSSECRCGAHATHDQPKKGRTAEELEEWYQKYPDHPTTLRARAAEQAGKDSK